MKSCAGVLGAVIGVLVFAVFAFRGDDAVNTRAEPGALSLMPEPSPRLRPDLSNADRESAHLEVPSEPGEMLPNLGKTTVFIAPEHEVGASAPGARHVPETRLLEERDDSSVPDGALPEVMGAPAVAPPPGLPGENEAHDASSLAAIILSALPKEHTEVSADLAEERNFSREDLLAMYGRSSAASGRFAHAAAAYAMFLQDYGSEHEYSAEIALRLADSLAPLDLDSIQIVHTRNGPVYHPRWRMGFEPGRAQLRLALPAYELAAELADDDAHAGRALLRRGWVCRALGEWESATAAWDYCVSQFPDTEASDEALRLAADNLAWTRQPAAAAQRLRVTATSCPDQARVQSALARVESLEAEARRQKEWFIDPVASLEAEIEQRAEALPAPQVYKSVLRWLQRRGERAHCVTVSLWACTQTDWPVSQRISAYYDLTDALLNGAANNEERLAAAHVLGEIVSLSDDNRSAMPAALRRCRLLTELEHFEEAGQALSAIEDRVAGSFEWEPRLLLARVQSLVAQGDHAGARDVRADLQHLYPDYELPEELEAVLDGVPDEEELK